MVKNAAGFDLPFEVLGRIDVRQQHNRHLHLGIGQELIGVFPQIGVQFLFADFDLGLNPVFEQLIQNQLLAVAQGLFANLIGLIQTLLARFLHQQFAHDQFIQKTAFPAFLFVARARGLRQVFPADVEFGLSNGSAVDHRDHRLFLRWFGAGGQRPERAETQRGAGQSCLPG